MLFYVSITPVPRPRLSPRPKLTAYAALVNLGALSPHRLPAQRRNGGVKFCLCLGADHRHPVPSPKDAPICRHRLHHDISLNGCVSRAMFHVKPAPSAASSRRTIVASMSPHAGSHRISRATWCLTWCLFTSCHGEMRRQRCTVIAASIKAASRGGRCAAGGMSTGRIAAAPSTRLGRSVPLASSTSGRLWNKCLIGLRLVEHG